MYSVCRVYRGYRVSCSQRPSVGGLQRSMIFSKLVGLATRYIVNHVHMLRFYVKGFPVVLHRSDWGL